MCGCCSLLRYGNGSAWWDGDRNSAADWHRNPQIENTLYFCVLTLCQVLHCFSSSSFLFVFLHYTDCTLLVVQTHAKSPFKIQLLSSLGLFSDGFYSNVLLDDPIRITVVIAPPID